MKTACFLLCLMLIGSTSHLFGQKTHSASTMLPMVRVPDSTYHQLSKFLLKMEHSDTTSAVGALIYNFARPRDYKFKDGIYTFRLSGPHFQHRLFIYRKGKLTMFEHHHTEGLLEEFLNFIKTTPDMSQQEKVTYLGYISKFLKNWIESSSKTPSGD